MPAPAVPLLLQRAGRGLGPRIPVRVPARVVTVEGLAPMDKIVLIIETGDETRLETFGPGETYLAEPIPVGARVRARLDGIDSCVSVWLD